MQDFQSGLLGWLIKIGAGAGIFFLWTVVETQIIEPFNLYPYLPFYRVNGICPWDILAIVIISIAFLIAGHRASAGAL